MEQIEMEPIEMQSSANMASENSSSNMPNVMQSRSQMLTSPSMSQSIPANVTYPEIYFRLQPYLMMARHSFASLGRNPTQEELDQMSDSIYDDICYRDPGLKEYLNQNQPNDPPAGDPPPRGGRPGSRPGFGFRRRGVGRDFVDALLLAQLFGNPYPLLFF